MKVDNVKVYDMEESIRASKYPMATDISTVTDEITKNTIALATCPKGTGHDNFLGGILVAMDLTFSNKAWVEAERYNFFKIVSSQSTMHRIARFDLRKSYNEYVDFYIIRRMEDLVKAYDENPTADNYLTLLYSNPAGFELTARITTNYRQLKTIYSQRKAHRLPEWREFCKWIETLPHAKELIIGDET